MDEAQTVPLTWQDQAVADLEHWSDPWNIQLEVASAEALDADRLSDAVRAACTRHPLMGARLERGGPWAARSSWRPGAALPVEVRTVDVSSDGELDELRSELYGVHFDLTEGPLLRVVLVRRTGEDDLVLFCAAHPVVDGIGLLRFVLSVTRAYRELPDPGDPVPLSQARDLQRLIRPASWSERVLRAGEGGAKLLGALNPPARVAPDSALREDRPGLTHWSLDSSVLGDLDEVRAPGVTLNDVLLAGVMIAVQQWNDQRHRGADKVQLFMPVSLRPPEWSTEIVSNLVSYASISTTRSERSDLASAALFVSRRTRPVVRTGAARGTQDLLRWVDPLPLAIKDQMPRLLTLTGDRFVDTAVVSNLGRPATVPSFTDDEAPALRFTPPCWSAASISLGAVSSGDTLHLGLRHRLSTLDRDAGRRFAELVTQVLTTRDAGS